MICHAVVAVVPAANESLVQERRRFKRSAHHASAPRASWMISGRMASSSMIEEHLGAALAFVTAGARTECLAAA
jgi:hypothetical protein